MVHIETVHTFPGSVSEVFGYVVDPTNWHEYWPGFVRIENLATARWEQPGDQLALILRLLRRDRTIHMTLDDFRTNQKVAYRTRQHGLPDARHERHFTAVADGVGYRAVVAYQPRRGVRGLFDRIVVKRAVERALRKTTANLDRVLTIGSI